MRNDLEDNMDFSSTPGIGVQAEEKKKMCSNCRRDFSCYTTNCWCSNLPLIMPINTNGDCFCPDCLKAIIKEKQA